MYKFMKETSKKFEKVSEDEIKRVENKYNIRFPEVIRNYYLEYNIEYIRTVYFHAGINGNKEFGVHGINEFKNVEKYKDIEIKEGWTHDGFYPFAYDEGGNTYYWSSIDGKVFLLYNDDIENEIFVCNSVKEMFKLMEDKIDSILFGQKDYYNDTLKKEKTICDNENSNYIEINNKALINKVETNEKNQSKIIKKIIKECKDIIKRIT